MQLQQRISSSSSQSRASAASLNLLLDEIGASLGSSPGTQQQQGPRELPVDTQQDNAALALHAEAPAATWEYSENAATTAATQANSVRAAGEGQQWAMKQQPRLTAIVEESSSCISSPTASSVQPTPRTLPAVGSSTLASAVPSGLTSPFSSTLWMSGQSAATAAAAAAKSAEKALSGSDYHPPMHRNSSSISRQLRHTSSGSSSRTAATQQTPATPAATAAATDGFDPHPSYTTTPAMSGHNSSSQLAGLGSPSSPIDKELSAFLGEPDPVDSWVATHCQGALPPQPAWSSQQSRASTRRDSSGNTTAAAGMQAAVPTPATGDAQLGEDAVAAAAAAACWDSPTSIAAAAAGVRSCAEASEASSAGGSTSASAAAAAATASATRRSSGLDHELSIGWRDCRRSSSAQHSDGLQQVCAYISALLIVCIIAWPCQQMPGMPAAVACRAAG
jgi:hypothetical protein